MDLSPEHEAARVEASRLPALYASLALLQQAEPLETAATIGIYGTARPVAGDPPGGSPIVTLELVATAGTINDELTEMRLATPISAQITGADADTGTVPTWARINYPGGNWWSDVSVSVDSGGGEIEMPQTGTEGGNPVARLFNGATALISSAIFRG